MLSEKPTTMRSTPSLRRFPSIAFNAVPMFVWLTMALSRPFKEDRRSLSSFHASLLRAIDGVMTLVFVPADSVSSSSMFQILPVVSINCTQPLAVGFGEATRTSQIVNVVCTWAHSAWDQTTSHFVFDPAYLPQPFICCWVREREKCL